MLERVAEVCTIALVNTCDSLPHLTLEAIEMRLLLFIIVSSIMVMHLNYHLKSEPNTVSRKIIEAMYINQLKPKINDKEECTSINRFLVKN